MPFTTNPTDAEFGKILTSVVDQSHEGGGFLSKIKDALSPDFDIRTSNSALNYIASRPAGRSLLAGMLGTGGAMADAAEAGVQRMIEAGAPDWAQAGITLDPNEKERFFGSIGRRLDEASTALGQQGIDGFAGGLVQGVGNLAGSAVFGEASAIQNVGYTYREGLKQGLTPGQASKAAVSWQNAVGGTLEASTGALGRVFKGLKAKPVAKELSKSIWRTISRKGWDILKTAATEGGGEVAEDFLMNMALREQGVDKNLFEDWKQNLAVGGALGAITAAVFAALPGKGRVKLSDIEREVENAVQKGEADSTQGDQQNGDTGPGVTQPVSEPTGNQQADQGQEAAGTQAPPVLPQSSELDTVPRETSGEQASVNENPATQEGPVVQDAPVAQEPAASEQVTPAQQVAPEQTAQVEQAPVQRPVAGQTEVRQGTIEGEFRNEEDYVQAVADGRGSVQDVLHAYAAARQWESDQHPVVVDLVRNLGDQKINRKDLLEYDSAILQGMSESQQKAWVSATDGVKVDDLVNTVVQSTGQRYDTVLSQLLDAVESNVSPTAASKDRTHPLAKALKARYREETGRYLSQKEFDSQYKPDAITPEEAFNELTAPTYDPAVDGPVQLDTKRDPNGNPDYQEAFDVLSGKGTQTEEQHQEALKRFYSSKLDGGQGYVALNRRAAEILLDQFFNKRKLSDSERVAWSALATEAHRDGMVDSANDIATVALGGGTLTPVQTVAMVLRTAKLAALQEHYTNEINTAREKGENTGVLEAQIQQVEDEMFRLMEAARQDFSEAGRKLALARFSVNRYDGNIV